MDESTFPYRVDERTRTFLSDLIGVMQKADARFSSHSSGIQLQFLNKGTQTTTIDAPMAFTQEGVQMNIPLNAVAKTSPAARTWLKRYQEFIDRGKADLSPVPQRCSVTVAARVDGQLRYHLTYMVAHEDGTQAQDMPQGRLYATEALGAPSPVTVVSQPAGQQNAGLAEPASWLVDED